MTKQLWSCWVSQVYFIAFTVVCFFSSEFFPAQAQVPELALDEKPHSMSLTGRALIDANFIEGPPDLSKSRYVQLRSARLGIKGGTAKRFEYKLDLNLNASGELDLADAYFRFGNENQFGSFAIGRFKPPVSLDDRTSSRFTQSLERAGFVSALDFERETGIWYQKSDALQVFGVSVSSPGSFARENTVTGFYSRKWRFEDAITLYYGGSLRLRNRSRDAESIEYDSRPYSRVLPSRFREVVGAKSEFSVIGELAADVRGIWVSGEFVEHDISCRDCGKARRMQGGYLDLRYMIGGVHKFERGEFKRPQIETSIEQGGVGGVSLGLRYDFLSARFGDKSQKQDLIIGADWWPNENYRIGLNLFHSEVSSVSRQRTIDTGGILRMQIDF